jgi:hypothetical protein
LSAVSDPSANAGTSATLRKAQEAAAVGGFHGVVAADPDFGLMPEFHDLPFVDGV